MEYTFGNSKGAGYLEDILKKYPRDKRKVSALLANIFRNINSVESNENFTYISGLMVDDFTKKLETTVHVYGDDIIKSLMRNLVVGRRKVILDEKSKIERERLDKLKKFNRVASTVRNYLVSNGFPDLTHGMRPDNTESIHIVYNMAEQIRKKEQSKNNPKR
jgi:hypothetical protein